MDEPITIKYRWTANEMVAAREYHFRNVCRPVFRWILSFIAVLAILAGWGSYTEGGLSWRAVLFPLLGIYWLFLHRWDRRWTVRRHFRKRPDKDMTIEWTATENDFCIKTPESEARSTWKLIASATRTREGFLLYPNEGLFYWLPFHAFSSPDQIDRLEQILQQHVFRYTRTR